jgi:hypothetical protein
VNPPNVTAEASILTQYWWDIRHAIGYFGAIYGEVSPKEAVVERIARLHRGCTTKKLGGSSSWRILTNRNCVCSMRLLISN